LSVTAFGIPQWVSEGPGPINNGNNVSGIPNAPQSGAINAVAADPNNAARMFVATVNGGIWVTYHATSATPDWIALTDQLPSLGIGAISFSLLDPGSASNPNDPGTLFAGTAKFSSGGGDGGPLVGVYRTTDGGSTWSVLGQSTFAGQSIAKIIPTAIGGTLANQVVLVFATNGIYRSTDGGVSWGAGPVLPGAPNALVADPSNSNRFFASISTKGIYRSDDAGLTWNLVNLNIPTTVITGSGLIEMAVHNNFAAGTNAVYAAVYNGSNQVVVYRSTNTTPGGTWTAMDATPPMGTGGFAADPTNANLVYIGGQPRVKLPNCNNNTARIFLGNAAGPSGTEPGSQWTPLVCDGANGTAPHPDSRDLEFDAGGNLLNTDDGGIYRFNNNPHAGQPTNAWVSLNGDIQPTEFYSVAYDSLNHAIFGGTQDNGSPEQKSGAVWSDQTGGDGGVVAVDDVTVKGFGRSIHYSTSQNLQGFKRQFFDNTNNPVAGTTGIGLVVNNTNGLTLTGPGSFATPGSSPPAGTFDNTIQFIQLYVLNSVVPTRMLIGTAFLYESANQGDTLNSLGGLNNLNSDGIDNDFDGVKDDGNEFSPKPVIATDGIAIGQVRAMAYGGISGGVANANLAVIAGNNGIFIRTTANGAFTHITSYTGVSAKKIVLDAGDWNTAYLLDFNNQIWMTTNLGAATPSWSNLTGNLTQVSSADTGPGTTDLRTMELYEPTPGTQPGDEVLLVGGLGGVYRRLNSSSGPFWSKYGGVLGAEIPNVLVKDLHYYSSNDILVAGTYGRGAWVVPNASQTLSTIGVLQINGDTDFGGEDDIFRLVLDPTYSAIRVYINNNPTPAIVPIDPSTLQAIQVNGLGGHNTLILDGPFGNITDNIITPTFGAITFGTTSVVYTGISSLIYTNGGPAGHLRLVGGPINNESVALAPDGAGTITLDGATISYNTLVGTNGQTPVDDLMTATNFIFSTFSFHSDIENSLTTPGLTVVDGNLPIFPETALNIANKTNVTMDGGNGRSDIVVDLSNAGAIRQLTVIPGHTFGAQVSQTFVETTPSAATTTVDNTRAATNKVVIHSPSPFRGVQDIFGMVVINDPFTDGKTSLQVDDTGDPTSRSVFINRSSITYGNSIAHPGPAPIRYDNTVHMPLTVNGDDAGNSFFLQNLGDANVLGPSLTLHSGGGRDSIIVNAIGRAFGATVDGGPGFDSLSVISFGQGQPYNIKLGPGSGQIATLKTTIYYQNIEHFSTADTTGPLPGPDLSPPSFNNAPNSPAPIGGGLYPLGLVTSDFNGDQIADLATGNFASNNISILLGNGNGSFHAAAGALPAVSTPEGMATADFNGDGNADLVAVDAVNNVVNVLLGNGNGTFQPAQSFPTELEPLTVATADFNGDGKADLVATNFISGTLSLMFGNGNGSFSPAPGAPLSAGKNPSFVAVGDYNSDGVPDMAVTSAGDHAVNVFLNNGDGSFRPAPGGPIAAGTNPVSAVAADLNRDGIQDLAITDYLNNTLRILLGNGDGSFRPGVGPIGVGSHPVAVGVADFNADGFLDLSVANSGNSSGVGHTMTVLLGSGDGSFVAEVGSPFAIGLQPAGLAIADFNRDGVPDIADADSIAFNTPGTVTVLLNSVNAPIVAHGDLAVFGSADHQAIGVTVATFTDPDRNALPTEYTATINWGDGSATAGAIAADGSGTFHVFGSHTYFFAGPYPINVAITNPNGESVGVGSSAYISTPGTLNVVGDINGQTDDVILLHLDPANSNILQMLVNGQVAYDTAITSFVSVTIDGGAGHDIINIENVPSSIAVIVNADAGTDDINVTPQGQNLDSVMGLLTVNGNIASKLTVNDQKNANFIITQDFLTNTALSRIGQGINAFGLPVIHVASINFGGLGMLTLNTGTLVNVVNVEGTAGPVTVNPGPGTAVILVDETNPASPVTIGAGVANEPVIINNDGTGSAAAVFASTQRIGALTIGAGGSATVAPGGGKVLTVSSIAISGTGRLDLTDEDMIVDYTGSSPEAAVRSLLASGFAAGAWTGPGINSSSAASNPNHLTSLAILLNDKGNGTPFYTNFDGQPADASSVLVKYTYNGDADLSGKIDADDYFQIDNGFATKLAGYRNGDFDFNGSVDADDYFLIDRAFVGQTSVLATLQPTASTSSLSKVAGHRRSRHHRSAHG
jgi:hypothetical protein